MAYKARRFDPEIEIADKAASYSAAERLQQKDFSLLTASELETVKRLTVAGPVSSTAEDHADGVQETPRPSAEASDLHAWRCQILVRALPTPRAGTSQHTFILGVHA